MYSSNDTKISFVSGHLRHVKDRDELLQIMNAQKAIGKLSNLDLSDVDVSNMLFSNFELENIIFNIFNSDVKKRKELFNVDFEGCKLSKVSFVFCNFERCNFDSIKDGNKTILREVDFFFSTFMFCRFKLAEMELCDFRYSEITNCSMGMLHANICDFYMALFKGTTNFVDSKFSYCSITNAVFENYCITMRNIEKLAQEDYFIYSEKIINYPNWYKLNPCASQSFLNKSEQIQKELLNAGYQSKKELILESKQYIAKEAQIVYTILSGIYTGKGLNHDSNDSYRAAKICEINYYWQTIKLSIVKRHYWQVLVNSIKIISPTLSMILGFGFMFLPILFISCLIVIIFGSYIYEYSDSSSGFLGQDIIASMHNMLSPLENHFNHLLDKIIALVQTSLGILILGYLGFVLANKIRNDG